ncbi:universal stress protein [Nocardia sp. NPDC059246]|uniref:universal stress protein n=1 Tax=unclassified Nocardia TaxID=2637762 RepID=UPI00368894A9
MRACRSRARPRPIAVGHAGRWPRPRPTRRRARPPASGALIERSRQARLLVVGNRGLGAIGRAVLGSASTALLHLAQCPVLVVRQPSQNRAEEPAGQ